MASRYGRNKKRQHRERIAELEKQNSSLTKDLRDTKTIAARLYRDLNALHEALNRITPYSAFLPPKALERDLRHFERVPFYVHRLVPHDPVFLDDPPWDDEPRYIDALEIPMYKVKTQLLEDRARFEYLIHFVAVGPKGDHRTAYHVSYEMLRMARGWEPIFARLTEDCLTALIGHMKKHHMGNPLPSRPR